MSRAGLAFSAISLAPAALICAACLWGGGWAWIALAYLTVFAFAMDSLSARVARREGVSAEFPAQDTLAVALALVHFVTLAAVVLRLGAGPDPGEAVALFVAAGMFFGQVSNANAHELIHRGNRWLNGLGRWVYISLLFGHHASAHPQVHHRWVATPRDPNTARLGESYWHFAPRAWIGSFRAGRLAETMRRTATGRPHPYWTYLGGGLLCLGLALALGGPWGALGYLGLAGHAQAQLLMSDYVQHYGLQRRTGPDGRPEPVGPAHSWNAPHPFTARLLLNAPRHSDHHAHPARPYPDLRLPAGAPMLPYSLPAMSVIALFPRLWRRVMDRRVAALCPPQTPARAA